MAFINLRKQQECMTVAPDYKIEHIYCKAQITNLKLSV